MDPERKKVFYYAVCSRFVYLSLSAFSNVIIPDHDSDSFKAASYVEKVFHTEDKIIWDVFGGLMQWDAHHYLHIAQFGYTYENNLAFFPLFPFLLRTTGDLLKFTGIGKSNLTANLVGGLFINNIIFIKTVLILYDMTLFIFNDTKFSFRSAIFYCVSPATVFFIAPYTETLFSYCAFNGMFDFVRRRTNASLFWFFLTACIRSNGITYAGFILHAWAYYCLSQLSFSSLKCNIHLVLNFTYCTIKYVLYIFSPYIVFQIFCYMWFCLYKQAETNQLIIDHAEIYNLTMRSDKICWCNKGLITPYFAVQEKFWDVGFLKYYKFKQIPNFMLALPICYVILYHGFLYLKRNVRMIINPKRIYSYGTYLAQAKDVDEDYPPSVFLFFIHVLFLTIWGLLHINVQVLTRLIASSSPVLYWIASNSFESLRKISTNNNSKNQNTYLKKFFHSCYILPFEKDLILDRNALIIKWYFISYSLIGILLFSNGLPWT